MSSIPRDSDERLVDVPDRLSAGGPQQQVPIFVLAAWDRLVKQADTIEQGSTTQQERRGVQHRQPRGKQLVVLDQVATGQPRRLTAVEGDDDPTGEHLGVRLGPQPADLRAELAEAPQVVVVTERDQLGRQGLDAAVARSGQTRGSRVRGHPDAAPGRFPAEALVGFLAVEDHDHLDPARIVLVPDRRQCPPQQLGPVPGRYDDPDRRPRGTAASTPEPAGWLVAASPEEWSTWVFMRCLPGSSRSGREVGR